MLLRRHRLPKFPIVTCSVFVIYIIWCFKTFTLPESNVPTVDIEFPINLTTPQIDWQKRFSRHKRVDELPTKIKFILLWTPEDTPFSKVNKRGRAPFIFNDCKYTNCFLTHNKYYFRDQTKFDAVVFSIASLKSSYVELPKKRSPKQKYVAASIEPPVLHSVANPQFDNFFNWTWTYRLNSDIFWRYFRVYNSINEEVGPSQNVKWIKKFDNITAKEESILYRKTKAVVWLVNNCNHDTKQLKYVKNLEKELSKYDLSVDTYGTCYGKSSCGNPKACYKMIENDYHFFLAFETYSDKDFVTDIVLIAAQHFVIPVVYGGANYTRYLPPESYLDATQLNVKNMAKKMDDIIGNSDLLQTYFKWTKHYTYKPALFSTEICNICSALNNKDMVEKVTVYKNFRKWWNDKLTQLIHNYIISAFEKDNDLKKELKAGNYTNIRKLFKLRHLPKELNPEDTVFVFDFESLDIHTVDSNNVFDANATETSEMILVDDD